MHESRKPSAVTLVFFVLVAVWLASATYQEPSFYRWQVGGWFETALFITVLSTLAAVFVVILSRALRQKSFPAAHLAVFGGAIVAAELLWRFWISRGPADFKLIGAVLDAGTPIVAALGIWALLIETASGRSGPLGHSNSTMT